jgi:hypothetical protein
MKINDILLEAPKKKATKKNPYKPEVIADLDMQEAAIAAANKIATFIRTKCKPWLAASKNGSITIYRGISDRGGLAFTKKTREDRRPKDTGAARHQAFNAAIAAAGGVANRSNSLFSSSDDDVAMQYGTAYVLIPVGNFNYTWSPNWDDWTGSAEMSDLAELLAPKALSQKQETRIKALKASFPAYKEKKKAEITAEYQKKAKELPAKIKAKKARLAKLKNKHTYTYSDLAYDIRKYEEELQELKTPANFTKRVNKQLAYRMEYDDKNPLNQIKSLQDNRSGGENANALKNPKSYDPEKARKIIIADKQLDGAWKSGNEIMVACEKGLYIKPTFYKKFVLPTLTKKKVTAKYNPNDDDDDDDGYW